MVIDKDISQSIRKQDLVHIAILLTIALVIGVYLIATTVLISKDGVFYIERAQKFSSDPIKIIKAHPPGYPFLILMAHKFAMLFNKSSSVFVWIYSAQSVTLLCRLLALIPLYFMGKLLVGGKNSFLAILILIFLPSPAKFVCDVLREWPYLLFLATGFFFLLWGARKGKWWVFGFVGLSSGLGYLIRHESAQLVLYGFLWVAMSVLRPKLWDVSRWKNLFALALLLVGFAIPAAPYMKCTGKIISPKVDHIIKSFSLNPFSDKTDEAIISTVSSNFNTAEVVSGNFLKALSEIFSVIGENLMWFFVLPLMVGLYWHFHKLRKALFTERFFIFGLIVLYLVMMVSLHVNRNYISRRHCMPLVVFTIFYVPVGLQIIGNWLSNNRSYSKHPPNIPEKKRVCWFVILLLIGIGICMPKLLRPVRIKKQGYIEAANWLMENTSPADIIALRDRRIAFYAERKGVVYDEMVPKQAQYVARIVIDGDEKPEFGLEVQEKISVWIDKKKKDKRIVIYKVL